MRRSQAWFSVFIAMAALLSPMKAWCQAAADAGQAQDSAQEPSGDDAAPSVLSVSTGTAEDADAKTEESTVEESTAAVQDMAVAPEDAGVDVSSAPAQDATAAADDAEVSESTAAVKDAAAAPDAPAMPDQSDEESGSPPSAAQEETREKAQSWIGVMEEDSNDADDEDAAPASVSKSTQPAVPSAVPVSK